MHKIQQRYNIHKEAVSKVRDSPFLFGKAGDRESFRLSDSQSLHFTFETASFVFRLPVFYFFVTAKTLDRFNVIVMD